MDVKNVVKILLRLHEQGFFQRSDIFYFFDGKYKQLSVVSWRKFHTLKTSGFQIRLLALVASDLSKAEIIIAYPV